METALLWMCFVALALFYVVCRLKSAQPVIYAPDALVFATASHTLGSLMLSLERDTSAIQHVSLAAFISFAFVVFFTIAIIAATRLRDPGPIPSYFYKKNIYKNALVIVTFANLLIILLIFSNPAIASLIIASFSPSSETTLLAVRKAITASTEGYMSPGLIKLVRDQISPIVFVSFIISRPNAHRSILLWVAVLCTIFSVLIGGQRFPMLLIIVAIFLGFLFRRSVDGGGINLSFGLIARYGFFVLFSFYVMSFLLGRTIEGSSNLEAFLWSLTSLFGRIFYIVPLEAVKTHAFWSTVGPTGGLSWLSELKILLPGAAGETLSNLLHQISGGSAQGNAPLFFAIDAWFAFGWVGIPFVSLLFVLSLHIIDTTLWNYRSPCNDAVRIVFYLNVPLMYSPYLFLLYGGIIAIIIVSWTLITRGIPSMWRIQKAQA